MIQERARGNGNKINRSGHLPGRSTRRSLLQKGGKRQELLGLSPSLPDPSLSEKPGGLQVSLPHGPTGSGVKCLGTPGTQLFGAQAPRLGEIHQLATQPDPAVSLGPSLTPWGKGAWRRFSPSWQGALTEGVRAEMLWRPPANSSIFGKCLL